MLAVAGVGACSGDLLAVGIFTASGKAAARGALETPLHLHSLRTAWPTPASADIQALLRQSHDPSSCMPLLLKHRDGCSWFASCDCPLWKIQSTTSFICRDWL